MVRDKEDVGNVSRSRKCLEKREIPGRRCMAKELEALATKKRWHRISVAAGKPFKQGSALNLDTEFGGNGPRPRLLNPLACGAKAGEAGPVGRGSKNGRSFAASSLRNLRQGKNKSAGWLASLALEMVFGARRE
ncbi:hypothetical protein GOBAR_AA15873 [Gossypium barbadense]|uniref:Uncharacterized protein n=1 Tax=Gossypium barbadense TaxID=3634 RepID=A0A2P5XN90_GOSBA|nr:hypothetical protein GOBAR_AA15873 [Gossypium barbadense]